VDLTHDRALNLQSQSKEQINELMMIAVEFSDFDLFGAVGTISSTSQLLTLINVTCTNLSFDNNYGFFNAGFADFYSDGLTFTNCRDAMLIILQPPGHLHSSILIRLVTNSVVYSDPSSYGLIRCLGLAAALVVELATFKNTSVTTENERGTYFESSAFIAAATPLHGLRASFSGVFSAVDCTFHGFETGISLGTGGSYRFICHSIFDACATCISMAAYGAVITSCVFQNYTIIAIFAKQPLHVINCVFDSSFLPAIESEASLVLEHSCFTRNDLVINGLVGGWVQITVKQRCFRASAEVALQGWAEADDPTSSFNCMTSCTAWIGDSSGVCPSLAPHPPPTLVPTRSHFLSIPAASAVETRFMTDSMSKAMTPPSTPKATQEIPTAEFTPGFVRLYGQNRVFAIGFMCFLIALSDL
jgi:hypothetical protein